MKKARSVEEYLASVPEPARTTLEKVRAAIRSVVPKETTEIISYGMPAFYFKRGLVAFAAFKDHCSFFPMSSGVIEQFRDELRGYETSKGTIRFSVDKPLPATLLKKIVKARLAQNELRVAARGGVKRKPRAKV